MTNSSITSRGALTTALLLGASLALAANPAAAPKAAGGKKFELKGDPAKGEATFKLYCVTCHGETGKGDGPAAAALQPKPAAFSDPVRAASHDDEFIYKVVKEGGQPNGLSPMMTAWGPVLNDDQKVRDVAAYVRTFSKKAAAEAAAPAAKETAKPAATPAKAPARK